MLSSCFCLILVAMVCSSCSGKDVSRAMGLHRTLPDEYTVTTRTPLSMPNSDVLVVPSRDHRYQQNENDRLQALETLSPDVALHGANGDASEGQSILLHEATQASQEADFGELGPSGSTEEALFWKSHHPGQVVNAQQENRRLKNNAALGQPVGEGVTLTKKH